MILGDYEKIDLISQKKSLKKSLPENLTRYFLDDEQIVELKYPQIKNLEKIKSFNIEKLNIIENELIGVKGQYLLFRDNYVLNVRKYTGYNFTVSLG